jgi:hypothetical protein
MRAGGSIVLAGKGVLAGEGAPSTPLLEHAEGVDADLCRHDGCTAGESF